MKHVLFLVIIFWASHSFTQKTLHIPLYLQDTNTVDGSQFTMNKTAESANFIIIWGNTVGTDPVNSPNPNLAFNPQAILDTMEMIYTAFNGFGFIDEVPGTNMSQYKIPVIMLNTWGPGGAEGFAYANHVDGVIGAFWVHPIAMQNGHVAAHEFTHALQAQTVIDYRSMNGFGPVWDHAGIFWETHANFMRNLLYPMDVTAWGMDVYHAEAWGDWKNTYENYPLLFGIMETEGIDMVNRLWRESLSTEYPLQAYKRLAGYNQQQFNDKMYQHIRRMATYDFSTNGMGQFFRNYRANDQQNFLPTVQALYTIPEQDSSNPQIYRIPIERAPEEYSYNIIPLHPDPDSCSVIVKFKGHTEVNAHSGWRYGFVAANADGTVSRYSPVYANETSETGFALEGNEAFLYFVVMGAPSDEITTSVANDTWKGYPKHFRFPYEFSVSGAVPEGFQAAADFRQQLKSNGHLHSNGGGWVQNTASVANSVFVAPHAMVLGNSVLTGNVRVLNTALVKNATIGGNVEVSGNAFITGGIYADNALIKGQAFLENDTVSQNALVHMRARVSNYNLSGTIEVGGDVVVYNMEGNCNNGVYYRMTNYYEDNLLECDGRTATHPDNMDVNNPLVPFSVSQMEINCTCATYPDCLSLGITGPTSGSQNYSVFPNPASEFVTIRRNSGTTFNGTVEIYNLQGICVFKHVLQEQEIEINTSTFAKGVYTARINDGETSTALRIAIR